MSKLFFSEDLKKKIEDINSEEWSRIGVNCLDDLNKKIIDAINKYNKKFNIEEIIYTPIINGYKYINTYFGCISDKNIDIAYTFVIPPNYSTRSGILSQQVFPGLSSIIQSNLNCICNEISNLPVIIINLNNENITPSVAINIISAKILDFIYIDIFNRDEKEILLANKLNPYITNIVEYDNLIKDNSSDGKNRFFILNVDEKKVTFIPEALGTGTYTNQPYWYVIKTYPALYLSFNSFYEIDLSEIENALYENKTLQAFYNYAKKLKYNKDNIIQKIYYGAPGTGKSYAIKDFLNNNKISSDNIFRATFYSGYSYADFVGQLLPNIDEYGQVSYKYNKGIFTKALEKAYLDTSKEVFLILEELSRGDCSAIFGDLFQLLDREQDGPYKGYSRYFINNSIITKDIIRIKDDKLRIPPNLCIIGSVNISDQNVFVIDTAFKRRFDWEYISTKPIMLDNKYLNNVEINIINTDNVKISIMWVNFYTVLNKFITDSKWLNLDEDKQIGQFFIVFNENSYEKNKNVIKNKLLHYLWNDIHKISYKTDIKLFNDNITSFIVLYEYFENDKNIFSDDFFECLSLFEQNTL